MSTIAITNVRRQAVRREAVRPAARVRLTQRGRLVVFVASLLLVLGLAVFLGAGSVASERPGTPEPTQVIMVDAGDTLWDIAADLSPDGDVRAMMHRIERLNALDSGLLQAGQRLRVPVLD